MLYTLVRAGACSACERCQSVFAAVGSSSWEGVICRVGGLRDRKNGGSQTFINVYGRLLFLGTKQEVEKYNILGVEIYPSISLLYRTFSSEARTFPAPQTFHSFLSLFAQRFHRQSHQLNRSHFDPSY